MQSKIVFLTHARSFFNRKRITLLLWFTLTLPLIATINTASATTEKNITDKTNKVLYLNAYHRGYSWSDNIEHSLKEGLNAYHGKIELSTEYLDSRRFNFTKQENRLTHLMSEKYGGYHFDLIITSDNAAFNFAINNRDKLFPDTPIVFCGFNNLRPENTAGLSNITGVNEEVDLKGTIDLALAVHPNTKTLVFIVSTGDISSKRIFEIAKKSVLPAYQDKFNLVLLQDLPLNEIESRLKQLPENSLLFISGQTSDKKDDRALTPVENSQLISKISPFPAYGFWSFNIGTGALGGSIVTGKDQGAAAADMAVQILNGTPVDKIPLQLQSPTSQIFDYQVMQRFGIKEEQLPAGSTMINRPDSLWQSYKKQIITGIIIFILQTILVITLFFLVRQRKKALLQSEQSLFLARHSQAELQTLTAELEERVKERTQELAQNQERLERAKNELQRYVSLVDKYVPTSSTDTTGKIIIVSDAFCQISGFSEKELLGNTYKLTQHSETPASVYQELWTTIQAGQPWQGEFKNRRKNGEDYWVNTSIEPVQSTNGIITGYTSIQQDITDKKYVEQLSITDSLTQIYNRMKLDSSLQTEINRANRYQHPLSIILLDIDHFKAVNDTHGHQVGDEILIEIANLLRCNIRTLDILGRWGGEEFLIICPETNTEGAIALAEKLRQLIEAHIFPLAQTQTCSFGIAQHQQTTYEQSEAEDLLVGIADTALYLAKEKGRNRVEVSTDLAN